MMIEQELAKGLDIVSLSMVKDKMLPLLSSNVPQSGVCTRLQSFTPEIILQCEDDGSFDRWKKRQ